MIQQNVSLKNKNWFQTGGLAKFFTMPNNPLEFANALKFAQENKQDVFILGAGANVLISDEGFDGLVIQPKLNDIWFEKLNEQEIFVTAGAGTNFADLINSCFNQNALGLEEFSGIPGTIGGAVFINLHFFKFLLSQFLVSATIIDRQNQQTLTVGQNWFNFGYNQSTLQDRNFYLLDATFKLKAATDLEVAYAKGRSDEIIRYRNWRYPATNTCGSFFRNFHENEVTLEVANKKMIFIAYYLDKLGFKGTLQVGNAIVSHQHANMLVNIGNATSNDIINLAHQMQLRVWQEFGVIPQPECLLVGFKQYPLLAKNTVTDSQIPTQTKKTLKIKHEQV